MKFQPGDRDVRRWTTSSDHVLHTETLKAPAPGATLGNARIASVDAYRGLTMLLLLAEVLRTCAVAGLTGSDFWRAACNQQTHAAWVGMSLHDLIQPSFFFLVGVGCFLSLQRASDNVVRRTIVRSLALIAIGVLLQSLDHFRVNLTETLATIGLAYPFLVMIAVRQERDWHLAFVVILVGYWVLFALWPLPGTDFDYQRVHVAPQWLQAHGLSGFEAHWQKNSNAAWAIDQWIVNAMPSDGAPSGYDTGLTTLNFIPAIATMILGLLAGKLLTNRMPAGKRLETMVLAGASLVFTGWALGALSICPIVKAIWTPSWVLFSGGICLLVMSAFHGVVDHLGFTAAALPLRVIGANAIVAYAIYWIYPGLAFNAIRAVVGSEVFGAFGPAYEPFVYGLAVLGFYWLVLYMLYRHRLFVRL